MSQKKLYVGANASFARHAIYVEGHVMTSL